MPFLREHETTHMPVIGIDAGGTKTICLLADGEGTVLASARGPGANLQASGELAAEKVLHDVMDRVLDERDVRPDAICLGIAGVDRPGDADAIRSIMRRIGYKTRVLVVNDALVALTAGAGDRPGVVIVAGTGSIAYGRDAHGRAARAGGWGYVLGDEGGGFWIGRAALSAVVRQFDRRGPRTMLTEMVLGHLQLASPTELIHAIYDRGIQRLAIGGVAAVVQQAFEAGDVMAGDILRRAALELTGAATAVIQRLEMRGDAFPIVLAGGTLRGIPSLAEDVAANLSDVAPRSDVRVLQAEPAIGAVRLALAHARGDVVVPHYI
jgi:N-acetylglucosamine kinase-like BadF-type ATPase